MELTKDRPSPRIFRLWSALHAIGAAAERRVWTELIGNNQLHPNLFTILVGPPGVGKSQAITPMSSLLRKSGAVNIAPNDMTKQGMLDILGASGKGSIINGRPFDYHFLAIIVSEMSNFMSKYDADMAGILTDLFDCPPFNDEKKRTNDKGKLIPFPGISFLLGSATQNLGHTISAEMWGSGFMARVIMVYSGNAVLPPSMFGVSPQRPELEESIVVNLRKIGELCGPMKWEPEAIAALDHFVHNGADGAPLHARLANYNTRRWLHLTKLAMISALSELRMTVTGTDFETAFCWLSEAESNMTEIFKDMQTHEDGEVHEEMRSQMYALYSMNGRKPISHATLNYFLSKRVASHTIPRIIEVALAGDYFRRVAGTSGDDALYIPQPPKGSKDLGAF